VPAVTAAVLALGLLVPSFVVHRSLAQHRGPDLVGRYARAVLEPLPKNALLMVWGAEYVTPLQYAQRFHGVRPDVTVFSGDQVLEPWYVDNLVRELDVPRSVFAHKQNGTRIIDLFALERTRRPVYLDTTAMANVFTGIGYKPSGLVGEVVDGRGPQPITSADQVPAFANGTSTDIEQGANRGFPNDRYSYFYGRAHIELAKSLAKAKAYSGAADQLRLAAAVGRGSDQAYLTSLATALDSGSNLDVTLPALEQY
jgi:hypothetical protein